MQFDYVSAAQKVVFGAGAIEQFAEQAAAFGWQRLMLCTSPSQRKNGTVERIQTILGDRLVAVYDTVASHVPDHQVAAALQMAAENDVDAFIGLGGGSPIGMAKALSMELEAFAARGRHGCGSNP